MHRRGLTTRALLLTVVASLVVGCGSQSPSATPGATPSSGALTPSPAAALATLGSPSPSTPGSQAGDTAVYAGIEGQVELLRGLTATRKLDPTLLDEQGVRDYITQAFDRETDPRVLADTEAVYKHLGLLKGDASLRQIELDLLAGEVIGRYDPLSKQLYVASTTGQVGPMQKITFAHEFTHALQDQHFDLSKLGLTTTDQGDRSLARNALIEGDATISMTQWAQKYLTIPELLQIAGMDVGASQQQLDAAPAILREQLMFPYFQGMTFVQSIYNSGGWSAVDRIYSNPPDSTSQILHPELYAQHVKPVSVALPALPAALSSWKLTTQDTFGELQLGVWLAADDSTKQTASAQAVSQWAGDRIGLFDGPSGQWAVVLQTAWRSPDGASAFASAVTNAPHADGAVLDSCSSGSQVEVVIGSSATVADSFGCGGD